MFGFKRLHLKQPATKRPVYEFQVTNILSAWFLNHNWAAVTLPLFGCCLILYWTLPEENVLPHKRVHEFIHVSQAERPGWFYPQYIKALMVGHGYKMNPMEIEARVGEIESLLHGLPDWAKPQNL